MIEKYKFIPGYEGQYMVSNLGNVKSLLFGKEKLLQPVKMKNGYLIVNLYKNGKIKIFRIHRLVWEAFNGEIPEGLQINHKDENKTNNLLENLELLTPKENINFGTRNRRAAEALSKPIIGRNKITGEETEYPSFMEAFRQTGISHQNICKCCQGIRNSAGGYVWRYKE